MLTCYLDDSGTHDESPLVTIAGYVMADDGWAAFETAVEPIFERRGVKVLHAFDLQQSKQPFVGCRWNNVLYKQAFVSELCMAMKPHGPLGLSFTVTREVYDRRAREAGREQVASPYAWGFQVITNWILTSVKVGKRAREEGVAFVVERGSKNNGGVTTAYDFIRETYADELGNTLRGLSFAPKTHSRAIQMADLIAYYSYRRGMHLQGVPMDQHAGVPLDPVTKVILETCPHHCVLANNFGWRDLTLPESPKPGPPSIA